MLDNKLYLFQFILKTIGNSPTAKKTNHSNKEKKFFDNMNKDKEEDIIEDNDAQQSSSLPPTDYQRKSEKDKEVENAKRPSVVEKREKTVKFDENLDELIDQEDIVVELTEKEI